MANKIPRLRLTLLTGLLLLAPHLYAQDDEQPGAQAQPEAGAGNRAIEQITVTGTRTLLSMKNEIERIEEQMYRTFNEQNNSDELDIFCNSETRTTSHIIQRTCEPVFLTNLKKENALSAVSQIRNAYTDEGLDFVLLEYGLDFIESEKNLKLGASAKYEELSQEMLRIAQENPDYRDALLQIGQLKADYEAARKRHFESD